MPVIPEVGFDQHDAIAAALEAGGACVLAGFPDAASTQALRDDVLRLRDTSALRQAGIGRGSARTVDQGIRGDGILWLDDPRCAPIATHHLAALDVLRDALNRRLYLGLQALEAHYARYPPGAGYALHHDRFHDSDARRVSVVSYLNDAWNAGDGGALRLHVPQGVASVLPHGGTSVCFLSELAHEVLPARRERLGIPAWLRRD